MSLTRRSLKRAALLLFPGESLTDATLDGIVAEGFTQVAAGVAITPTMPGQGFSFEQGEELARRCGARGLQLILFTGYMKYQYELLAREPQRLLRLVGQGKVSDLDGLPVRWLCPFRPENRAHYLALLERVCRWPAVSEIHLNDEASLGMQGGRIGCYCDYCQADFTSQYGFAPPLEPAWEDARWYQWLSYRFEAWVQMHASFRARIKAWRPEIAVGIQHSPYIPERVYATWEAGVLLAREAQLQDMIATDPYHYNHGDGIKYRPHRRLLSETTRSLVGACQDRQVDIYPQGFMPPSQAVPMGRQDGLLAGVVPFALGADLVMPFTYELMKIIPGFFAGFQDARRLLPAMSAQRPYAFATMLLPQQSEIFTKHPRDWASEAPRQMVDLLYDSGLPWRWFWDGRLADAGQRLRGPIILPEAHCLTAQQRQVLANAPGGGCLWLGNTPAGDWVGGGHCPVPAPVTHGEFHLTLTGESPLTRDLGGPVILRSLVTRAPFAGEVLATANGQPALIVRTVAGRREAWLAGVPLRQYSGNIPGNPGVLPTGNGTLLGRLLRWLAARPPLAWLAPFPPWDAYRALRPQDRRAVPPIELLPMVSDDQGSLLAIVFPYTPVASRTTLHLAPPPGHRVIRLRDLWQDQDWTDRLQAQADGTWTVAMDLPGELELLALQATFSA